MIGILCLSLAIFIPTTALAHGDSPRLEISVERINPGGVVEVRGVDFEPEEQISFALIGTDVEIPLGEIIADTDGIFLQIVTLPSELKEGAYYFRAVTDDHQVISPTLTVFGAAILEGEGGQGPREEEDGLLAPMPTFLPAVVSTASAPSASIESTPAFDWKSIALVLTALAFIGIAVVFALRICPKIS